MIKLSTTPLTSFKVDCIDHIEQSKKSGRPITLSLRPNFDLLTQLKNLHIHFLDDNGESNLQQPTHQIEEGKSGTIRLGPRVEGLSRALWRASLPESSCVVREACPVLLEIIIASADCFRRPEEILWTFMSRSWLSRLAGDISSTTMHQ